LNAETRRTRPALLVAVAVLLAAGCRQNMHNQHKVKTLAASDFFPDGQGARPIPAHTVARGDLREGWAYSGLDAASKPVAQLPFPLTREVLIRGEQRFNIYCSPCHDRQGTGHGMIVQRGYKQPTSYHVERLRNAPVGYFYDVITEGFGVMPSYAPQVPVADRWAIAAYIRVLQYRQTAKLADLSVLPPERRQAIQAELDQAAATPGPAPSPTP